ncbi:uncharacterized protein LTR77_010143 [Saxophila tyrrhenica]|uniref:BTB domain-containing protein n=1 Tax=Saxophila tyrrhenica TaxID=1690608 RepID=A0AAV9NYS4_9PEZI|nr:hypothetical protein LTR77_010143 [Saxophila tyrrhenica]
MAAATAGEGGRSAKRTKLDFVDTITVLVGANEARFMLHKNVVCATSDFFRAACDGNWKEATDKVIRVPEAEPSVFQFYLAWLYTDRIDLDQNFAIKGQYDAVELSQTYLSLLNAYIFGDIIQDVAFRNALIDKMLVLSKQTDKWPHPREAAKLCQSVSIGSKMVRLLADGYACTFSAETFSRELPNLPAELIKLIAALSNEERYMSNAERRPLGRLKGFYHEAAKQGRASSTNTTEGQSVQIRTTAGGT